MCNLNISIWYKVRSFCSHIDLFVSLTLVDDSQDHDLNIWTLLLKKMCKTGHGIGNGLGVIITQIVGPNVKEDFFRFLTKNEFL